MTAYDAAFVALSESLPAPLLTCDAKLAATIGHRAAIDLISKIAGSDSATQWLRTEVGIP